ncbi:MAG: molybdopterin-dependent oxidoreductase [Acidobacteriota bacterium]
MSKDIVTIRVDGLEGEAERGRPLLAVLREWGIEVPTLCHDDRLLPYGGCRLCLVARRDGAGALVPACSTAVEHGMVIDTDAPEVIAARRRQLQLLLLDHPMECPVCVRRGECRLQDLVLRYGVPDAQLPFLRQPKPRDERSPLIVRDPEKCILCCRCVRLCDEVQGVAALGVVERGLSARIATSLDGPLDCEFCGQCVDACPAGALVARPFTSEVPPWQRTVTLTTCSFCSCGCELTVESHEGRLQQVRASLDARPNAGKLCAKGRFGWDLLGSDERLTQPLVRREGRLHPASWKEALSATTAALHAARDRGDAIVGLGSTRLTLEDAYLFQRLLRSVLGTPHVDCGPGRGVRALVEGVLPVLGVPRSTASFADLAASDVVMVLRADPTRTHPLVKTELIAAVRRRGQRLILAQALSGELGPLAEHDLAIAPGSEVALLYGLARQLAGDPRLAAEAHAVEGFDAWREGLASYTTEAVAAATGVTAETLAKVVETLRDARALVVVVVTGHGIPGDEVAVARAASELLVLLGRSGQAGSGILVLGEKADAQGVVEAGMHPALLPGGRSAGDPEARALCSSLWGMPVPAGPGWSAREALPRSAAGEVGVLYLVGRDPVDVWPQAFAARAAVAGASFVIVQDAFLTETARAADVVLPVAILLEREGSLVNAEGVRRPLRRAVRPPAAVPLDGELFGEIAARLGARLPHGEALERELASLLAGPAPERPRFGVPPAPSAPVSGTGLLLDAAPHLFHSGSTTRHSASLNEVAPVVSVAIAAADARRLGVVEGETVSLVNGDREILLRAHVDRRVRAGQVVALWNSTSDGGGALAPDDDAPTYVEVRRSR